MCEVKRKREPVRLLPVAREQRAGACTQRVRRCSDALSVRVFQPCLGITSDRSIAGHFVLPGAVFLYYFSPSGRFVLLLPYFDRM